MKVDNAEKLSPYLVRFNNIKIAIVFSLFIQNHLENSLTVNNLVPFPNHNIIIKLVVDTTIPAVAS